MKWRVFKVTFLLLFTFFVSVFGYSQKMIIVKDHKARAVIVIADSCSQQLKNAAIILQQYMKKSTGAELSVVTGISNKAICIHVGFTGFVRTQNIDVGHIDQDGYILKKADSHNFIIAGGSDWGTEFGVYSFLERYFGIAWLMPANEGTDIPQHKTVTLPDVNLTENPVYISRQISPVYINSKSDLGEWGRFNRLRGRINFSHNLLNLLNPSQFSKTNPDFYPGINGKKITPQGYKWQPNFSATGIADSAADNIIRYFKKNPDVTSYSLGINDYTTFDQSPQSLARRNGKKNFLDMEDVSDDYFRWVNDVVTKVEKVYPDKKFGLLAYNNVATPPSERIGVRPNVIPFLTYERMRWADTSLLKIGQQLTEDWGRVCPILGWYDYVYGYNYLLPRVWFHVMKSYMIWGAEHQVKYYYAELYPNWGEGPKPWILGKLLWNPYYNVDSLLDVWYVKTAGRKAAPKLREFYSIWETFWTKDVFSTKWNRNTNVYLPFEKFSYLEYVPKDYLLHADALIKEACLLTKTSLQKKRVGNLLKMWKIYKTAADVYLNESIQENQKLLFLKNTFQVNQLLDALEGDPLYHDTIILLKKFMGIEVHT